MDGPALAALLRTAGLPPSYQATIDVVLEPLADWIAAERGGGPLVVGLSGPQGSGKTTACVVLEQRLQARGLRSARLSIDDLYLPRAERLALAATAHPLLATRGPPGTHDLALGLQVLGSLKAGRATALPQFDKGLDDRLPAGDWPMFEGAADVILFEGWCVGAVAQDPADLASPINALERQEDPAGVWRGFVNAALARYGALFGQIDRLVQIAPPSFEVVLGWRQEQEAKLRARPGGAARAMSEAQVARFVAHYERLTRHMLAQAPSRADAVIRLGPDREPLSLEFRRP